ncbi:MAG: hypothetical protein MJY83_03435 [Bacteroidales bacterium]|nr:hypothetical protein [Bacteroidales bacterium]
MKRHILMILALGAVMACGKNTVPEPPVREPDREGESGELLFSATFDECVLKEGPQIQSDNFKEDCENPLSHISFKSTLWKTVGSSHVCDDEYMRSRGFQDWVYLFRVTERPGYLACGVNSEGKRGIIQSPMMTKIQQVSDVKISFEIKPDADMTDDICFKVCLAGVIRKVTVNGYAYAQTDPHDGIEHSLIISRQSLNPGWNKVAVEVEKATGGTMFYWGGASSSKSLNHGFYLDNVKVYETQQMERPAGSLRVLYWNIQNGMWSDQTADFANFRAFVKKYDPDVCVWCEAQSIYNDRSTSMCDEKDRFFPAGWADFAQSYGHKYTAIGGYRIYADDYFPQVVTSRYPVKTLLKITETDAAHQALADSYTDGKSHSDEYHKSCAEGYCPVAHGAAVQQVDVNGVKVNIVTLHLWPHAYSYYAKFVLKDQKYDADNSAGGNVQREREIRYICSRSIEDPKFAGEENWLMMGDFNTRSRLDNWRYKLPEDSPFLSSHDYILQHTDYKDIIGLKYPGHFFATRTWANDAAGNYPPRYDFMYASPAMYEKVANALVLNEQWTNMVWAMSNYYDSSDHRPILVDFKF